MNIKKFLGLLMVLAIAIFAFTACSSDDDDEKVGTFEYAVTCSSYEGGFDSMQKVDDAFLQAFGVTSTPITLTGTKSECNRKAKEYAMKAQAALANEGRFAADVEFVNVTTEEKIYAFSVKMDDNANKKIDVKYEIENGGITFYNMKGYRIQISKSYNYESLSSVIFNSVITEDKKFVDVYALAREKQISMGLWYVFVYEGTSTKPIHRFKIGRIK